ncbi:hypothetical protein FACS1894109_18080 [Spirochaetia bacterium]|nr:hypothetical protein FACS1894109_18080 [Spirochaetia bacterium]
MDEQDLRAVLSVNIKKYRKGRRITQEKLAEQLDISIPFLSDIENGKKWVSPHTLVKIADVFCIEAYELLKPERALPDKAVDIIEKYTSDVYTVFGQSLEELHRKYISDLNSRH